jgi:dipeptidyl aminopeptidase/acylaminoacyl peptidase
MPRRFLVIAAFLSAMLAATAADQRNGGANYVQAFKYSSDYLRQFVYSTSVSPQWIGKSDRFWYEYRTSKGTTFWVVDPDKRTKEPFFDHARLAAQLSEVVRKPLDPNKLALTRVSLNAEGTILKFVAEGNQFEYTIGSQALKNLGKAPPLPAGLPPGIGGGDQERMERIRQIMEERRRQLEQEQQQQQDQQQQQQDQRERIGPPAGAGGTPGDYRAVSPDKKWYLYVYKNNLYLSEPDKEKDAVALTTDGTEDYTFSSGFGGGFGGRGQTGTAPPPNPERKTRPNVTWSKDSKYFHVSRSDSRKVEELFLVDSIGNPRPKLEKYKYAMPGEPAVRKSELYVGDVAAKKLNKIPAKWKDEGFTNVHFGKTTDELRFVRRDRLLRNVEVCSLAIKTGEVKCLIPEGFENTNIEIQPIRYLEESDEMIWWSERSGWGHFYLYGRDGKLKNAITSGPWRASRIVAVDEKNRVAWINGNARETGENVYYEHLYRVKLDGSGLTLLTPGDHHHSASLSPSRKYLVDNTSRVDAVPTSVLRDADGNQVMELEQADLTKLVEAGWKMPETFVVKAADGVTDLYGNMWKPFDFDATKKYPIIANVYPGPQTEGVTHTFSAISQTQQLAQLGFIVIQVGHRGGTPTRSKAYHGFGYGNLRDYALADKKAAIEQLAARCSFIDIDRVGIYGHSGGGFLSAAALLQKPYNEFFKVAVASAGNHDNNIYNNSWAERYHGLKEVPADAKKDDAKKDDTRGGTGTGRGIRGRRTGADDSDDPEQAKKDDVRKDETKKDETKKDIKKDDAKKEETKKGDAKKDETKKDVKKDDTKKEESKKDDKKLETRFEIKVPTNAELAGNLKGALLLVHGEIDNNVHPANTMRLVDALIKANKRFDMLIIPGKRHGFADAQPYFQQRMWDFFGKHLLDDDQTGADIMQKQPKK